LEVGDNEIQIYIRAWASEGFFPRPTVDFSGVTKQFLQWGAKSGEI